AAVAQGGHARHALRVGNPRVGGEQQRLAPRGGVFDAVDPGQFARGDLGRRAEEVELAVGRAAAGEGEHAVLHGVHVGDGLGGQRGGVAGRLRGGRRGGEGEQAQRRGQGARGAPDTERKGRFRHEGSGGQR